MPDRGFPAADGGCVWLPALVPLPGTGSPGEDPTLPPPLPSQATNYCPPSPASYSCYTNISTQDFGCRKSCTGLYADVLQHVDANSINDLQVLDIIEEYQNYKSGFARNIIFDGGKSTKGEFNKVVQQL